MNYLSEQHPNKTLVDYLLFLGDSHLILSQNNAEWCGIGPELEQDIAITNITLDLLGQARMFYQYAVALLNNPAINEDNLALTRAENQYKNLLLSEIPRGDWAVTMLRQYFFSVFFQNYYQQLQNSADAQLAAIAAKAIKETTYHVQWSRQWVLRLGNGTEVSRQKMLDAIDELYAYTGEMFVPVLYENVTNEQHISPDLALIKPVCQTQVTADLLEATLQLPNQTFMHTGGKIGVHTEYLGFTLAEMQYMQKMYPNLTW